MEVREMNSTVSTRTTATDTIGPPRTLSPERAFVVQFHPAENNQTPVAGRVEHVSSGRAGHFDSWQELIDFVGRVVSTIR
jgi:hypothetical protein